MDNPLLYLAMTIFYFVILVMLIDAEPRVYVYLTFLTTSAILTGIYIGEREKNDR